jgi:hypothetical protein
MIESIWLALQFEKDLCPLNYRRVFVAIRRAAIELSSFDSNSLRDRIMRSMQSYFTMCPECDSRISMTLAAKLQAGRIGTSCICSQCKHTWICIQEWILSELIASPPPAAASFQPHVPAPHFQQQTMGQPGSSSVQPGMSNQHMGQRATPHLPTYQPSTLANSQAANQFDQPPAVNQQSVSQPAGNQPSISQPAVNQPAGSQPIQHPPMHQSQQPMPSSGQDVQDRGLQHEANFSEHSIDEHRDNEQPETSSIVPKPHWLNKTPTTPQIRESRHFDNESQY